MSKKGSRVLFLKKLRKNLGASIALFTMVAVLMPAGSVFAAEELFRETKNNFAPHPFIQPDLSTGAFTKSYPITVPPGRNGIQPDLKLTYSSQPGRPDSLFGYGWSLNIPYIERLNKKGVDNLYNQDFAHTYFYSSLSGELLYSTTTSPLSSLLGFSFFVSPLSYFKFFSRPAFAQELPMVNASSSDPAVATPLVVDMTPPVVPPASTSTDILSTTTPPDLVSAPIATSTDVVVPIPSEPVPTPTATSSQSISSTEHPTTSPVQVFQEPATGSGLTRFAEIDNDGIVLRVLVIDQDSINTGLWGDPKNWVQTNTDGSMRKNYAGKGYAYDKTSDAFIAPKPKSDATFDSATAKWIIHEPQVINATSTPL